MLRYETLLDLSRQRLSDIARSQAFTREVRQTALELGREVERELASFNDGKPLRELVNINGEHPQPQEGNEYVQQAA